MNLDEIFNYQRPKTTLYDLLGCHQSSTIEQISREYKIRALELHPDKNPNNPECLELFRQIQAAKDILCDETSRRTYDRWLDSKINIPFEQWQARQKGISMHWASPKPRNLSIQGGNFQGQGSEDSSKRSTGLNEFIRSTGSSGSRTGPRREKDDFLDKFRNYQI